MAKTAAVKASKKPLKKRIWDQRYLFLREYETFSVK